LTFARATAATVRIPARASRAAAAGPAETAETLVPVRDNEAARRIAPAGRDRSESVSNR
jgi:hypothetical protein